METRGGQRFEVQARESAVASAGSSFHEAIVVGLSVEEASAFLQKNLSGINGYSIDRKSDGSITLQRRFLPNWALLLALVGLFAFLLGLLALFVRETETGSILFTPNQDGTRITVSGTVSSDMRQRITEALQTISQRWPANLTAKNVDCGQDGAQTDTRVPTPDQYEQLLRIAELRDKGVLTNEEFDVGKSQILGG